MQLAIVSKFEVQAQLIKDIIIESFQIDGSGDGFPIHKIRVWTATDFDGFCKKAISQKPTAILLHTPSPQNPFFIKCLQWIQNSRKAIPVIACSDVRKDADWLEFIQMGVQEMIDLKAMPQSTVRRAILSAQSRFEIQEGNRDYERQLLASRLAAEQASNEKTFFVSMVTHEIRSPLQNITGFASLLAETKLDDEQSEYVSYLDKNSQLLTDLVSDVLDHAKLDQGTIALKIEPFAPNTSIEDAISFVETRALSKKISIITELDPTVPEHLIGDKLRIIQILKNLLDNAIKHTPESGTIHVVSQWTPSSESNGKGFLECLVRDTGSGIPAERLPNIFNPFVQGNPAMDQSTGGTGLGLALCKRLCEMMRGRIKVAKSDKEGTTLSFTLPFETFKGPDAENIDAKHSCASAHTKTNASPKILVIEDDMSSQAYIQRFLRYNGLNCDIADNGEEALKIFEPSKHALVITDIFMPIMNGIDVCARIREIEIESKVGSKSVIFAITAAGSEDIRAQAISAGADFFMRKPIRIDQLKRMIRDTIQKTKASPEKRVRPLKTN